MPLIIIKGSRFVKGGASDTWQYKKDYLHRRRKEIESDLRQTILSKDKMDMRDCRTESEEEKRVAEYDAWKAKKDGTGKSNEDKMHELAGINREFKKQGEEGRLHTMDDLRIKKAIKHD